MGTFRSAAACTTFATAFSQPIHPSLEGSQSQAMIEVNVSDERCGRLPFDDFQSLNSFFIQYCQPDKLATNFSQLVDLF
jgi:hypothetical protein